MINENNLKTRIAELESPRDESGNKGTFGTAVIIAGSENYRGCAALASAAALRSGCGIVRLVSTEKVCAAAVAKCPEITLFVTKEIDGAIDISEEAFNSATRKADAILVGCGMMPTESTLNTVKRVLGSGLPSVVDADGLNALAKYGKISMLDGRGTVITPHIGEMARLTGLEILEIKGSRIRIAEEFAKAHDVTVVLKDCVTVITDGEKTETVDIKNSGMAKGGSGDVLAGMICAYLAEGKDPFSAALLAVVKHSEKGLLLREKYGTEFMAPSDLNEVQTDKRIVRIKN